MKKIFFLLSLAISVYSFGQQQSVKSLKTEIPTQLLTDDSTHWTVSTLSTIGYVNTTPGANYNTYRSGGGMIVKFKFHKDGRYEFMLYIQVNTYGTATESWTHVEGTVEFSRNEKGNAIFRTWPKKGTYRYTKNGVTTTRPVPAEDLKKNQTTTYLWDTWQNPDDKQNDYMLLIDIGAHPGVDLDNPSTIDASWISKFHIPKRK